MSGHTGVFATLQTVLIQVTFKSLTQWRQEPLKLHLLHSRHHIPCVQSLPFGFHGKTIGTGNQISNVSECHHDSALCDTDMNFCQLTMMLHTEQIHWLLGIWLVLPLLTHLHHLVTKRITKSYIIRSYIKSVSLTLCIL